jgi:hypothetical protein
MDNSNKSPISSDIPGINLNPNQGINNSFNRTPMKNRIDLGKKTSNIFNINMKIFLIVTAVFIITGFTLGLLSNKNEKINTSAIAPTSYVYALKARIVYKEGAIWKDENGKMSEINEGDILGEKDEILTGQNSKTVLLFDDGSVLRIGEKTRINFMKLAPSEMRLREDEGELFVRVEKTENHKFYITAGNYTIESLGTIFSVENNDGVKVKVFDNSVNVGDGVKKKEIGEKEKWSENSDKTEIITDVEIKENKFITWSLDEEKKEGVVIPPIATKIPEVTVVLKPTTVKVQEPTSVKEVIPTKAAAEGKLTLTGSKVEQGALLKWEVQNLDVKSGFKLVKSLEANPSYPSKDFIFFESEKSNSFFWEIKDGKKWHFRVCQYLSSGQCGVYSNDVMVEVSLTSSLDNANHAGNVTAIRLIGEKSGNVASLNWSLDGYSSMGFKVVWSTNSSPVYPSRDGDSFHYYSEASKRSDTVPDLSSGKTYYFRVCEYLGGKCGVYSNEISLSY